MDAQRPQQCLWAKRGAQRVRDRARHQNLAGCDGALRRSDAYLDLHARLALAIHCEDAAAVWRQARGHRDVLCLVLGAPAGGSKRAAAAKL